MCECDERFGGAVGMCRNDQLRHVARGRGSNFRRGELKFLLKIIAGVMARLDISFF